MAKGFSAKRASAKVKVRLDAKMKRARIKRYKAETKAKYLKAKGQYKMQKEKAKNYAPLEKEKLRTSLGKHSVWAGTAGAIFGRGTSTAESIAKQNAQKANDASQNVNGGLQNTQDGRDDDEEKDVVDGGGVVY